MHLAAGNVPVAVKHRAVKPANKIKILNVFSNLKSRIGFEVPAAAVMKRPIFWDSYRKPSKKTSVKQLARKPCLLHTSRWFFAWLIFRL
jgi:hypothetical protein